MIPANKPLKEKACRIICCRCIPLEQQPKNSEDWRAHSDTKVIDIEDVLAKIKELRENLMRIYHKYSLIIPKTNTPLIPYLAVQREIDSVFGEDTSSAGVHSSQQEQTNRQLSACGENPHPVFNTQKGRGEQSEKPPVATEETDCSVKKQQGNGLEPQTLSGELRNQTAASPPKTTKKVRK